MSVRTSSAASPSQVADYVDTQTGGNGLIDNRLKSADSNMQGRSPTSYQANERIDAKESA